MEKESEMDDTKMWAMGAYVYHATLTALENIMSGNESKMKYYDKPLHLQNGSNTPSKSEEELALAEFVATSQALRSNWRRNHPRAVDDVDR